jgi:ferritin-like metal-binding protein YciE
MLGMAPTVAQVGHHDSEKNAQHLMICYAAAAAEMAMYEALATVAAQAGDRETEQLARQLQSEEKKDHQDSWRLLRTSVQDSWQQLTAA